MESLLRFIPEKKFYRFLKNILIKKEFRTQKMGVNSMARSGSFNLKISNNFKSIDILDLLDLFHSIGWSIDDHNMICYLPLGDQDFEWEFLPISHKEAVRSILLDKQKKKEIIGITITSEVTNIGLSMLLYPMFDKITLAAEINRKTIDGLDVTDFSWYLSTFIPVLEKAGLTIESIECIDG